MCVAPLKAVCVTSGFSMLCACHLTFLCSKLLNFSLLHFCDLRLEWSWLFAWWAPRVLWQQHAVWQRKQLQNHSFGIFFAESERCNFNVVRNAGSVTIVINHFGPQLWQTSLLSCLEALNPACADCGWRLVDTRCVHTTQTRSDSEMWPIQNHILILCLWGQRFTNNNTLSISLFIP